MHRIAFLSDIHGNMLALEAVVNDLNQRSVDTVITLGDLVSGPMWPRETIHFLMEQDWVQIAGNHERQLLTLPESEKGPSDRNAFSQLNDAERDWLRALPTDMIYQNEIALCHGAPGDDKVYLLETIENGRTHLAGITKIQSHLGSVDCPVLACGHSHTPRIIQIPGGPMIINPGSVGMPAYTDDGPLPHVVETGSPHARYAILEKMDDAWTAQLLAVPYDHETAARQADRLNRPELAMGLRTGYVTAG